jgi:hypothetical protein
MEVKRFIRMEINLIRALYVRLTEPVAPRIHCKLECFHSHRESLSLLAHAEGMNECRSNLLRLL